MADARAAAAVLEQDVAATVAGDAAWDTERKSPRELEHLPPRTPPLVPSNGNGRPSADAPLEAGERKEVSRRFSSPVVPRGDAASITDGVRRHADARVRKAATWPRLQVVPMAAFVLLAIGILGRACLAR